MKTLKQTIAVMTILAAVLCLVPTSLAAGRTLKLNPGELVTFGAYEQDGKRVTGRKTFSGLFWM